MDQGTRKRIAILGVGALGSAVVQLLACQGIADLVLIDGDRVEGPELVRQPLYGMGDVGSLKVQLAKRWVEQQGWSVSVKGVAEFLDHNNAGSLLCQADLVVDLTDDAHARALVDATCNDLRKPLVSGSVHGHQGQIFVLHQAKNLGLKDLFPSRVGPFQDGCDMRNVPLELIAIVAGMVSLRTKQVLRGDQQHEGSIDLFDMKDERWSRFLPPLPKIEDDLIASAS